MTDPAHAKALRDEHFQFFLAKMFGIKHTTREDETGYVLIGFLWRDRIYVTELYKSQ